MNQHVIDLYHYYNTAHALTNEQIIHMCTHFHHKLNPEHKETYADLLIYARDVANHSTTNPFPNLEIQSGPYHMKTTNHQPSSVTPLGDGGINY